ncbi:MAG: amidohydrolase family protein, partial [Alistipes sp.]|nr:amidohydrolase family protein [Alistipes sp.]
MDYKIIDAHAHLWLKQDAVWNGKRIQTLENGRSHFLGEEVQMIPPFMIDGKNTAEVFLSNMNYAQVSAAVITQEYIDGHQNDYLEEVQTKYPDRFFCCGMCEYFDEDVVGQAKALKERGFKAIKIPGNRLKTDAVTVELQDRKMADLFAWMEQEGMILSIDLDDDSRQIAQMDEILQQHPNLKTAI